MTTPACDAMFSWQSSEASEPTVRLWSVVACTVSIALTKRSLAWLGFERTLKRIRDRSERTDIAPDFSPASIAMADRVVAIAAALYPGRALCLERSLVLYDRLRRDGAAVELRIGVQATPFAAHAWVTYGGEPVNDSAEHVSHFIVMPDLRS
jgi:Transglutaminase-like superfamily